MNSFVDCFIMLPFSSIKFNRSLSDELLGLGVASSAKSLADGVGRYSAILGELPDGSVGNQESVCRS